MTCRKGSSVKVAKMSEHAQSFVKTNNLQSIIEITESSVKEIGLPEKSTWWVTFSYMSLGFDSVICSCDCWLRPTGVIYPSHALMWVAPKGDWFVWTVTVNDVQARSTFFISHEHGAHSPMRICGMVWCRFPKKKWGSSSARNWVANLLLRTCLLRQDSSFPVWSRLGTNVSSMTCSRTPSAFYSSKPHPTSRHISMQSRGHPIFFDYKKPCKRGEKGENGFGFFWVVLAAWKERFGRLQKGGEKFEF